MFRKVLVITKSSVRKNILQSSTSQRSVEYLQHMSETNYRQGMQVAEKLSRFFEVDVEPLDAVFDRTAREEFIWSQLRKKGSSLALETPHNDLRAEISEHNEFYNRSEEFKKKKTVDDYDFLVSIGGDGTFLSCSHLINDDKKPLLGINSSVESVGFLNTFKFLQFLERSEEIGKRILNHEYTAFKRKRFSCEFTALYSPYNRILGLNDVFIGTENYGSTLRYDFSVDGAHGHNIKSTGVLLYTGTGSSAWANSLNHINEQKLAIMFEYFNERGDSEQIEKLQDFIKEKYYIASDSNFMGYLHRELFITNGGQLRYEGIGRDFEIVNNTVNGFVAIDGFYYKLEITSPVKVQVAGDNQNLSCFRFD